MKFETNRFKFSQAKFVKSKNENFKDSENSIKRTKKIWIYDEDEEYSV